MAKKNPDWWRGAVIYSIIESCRGRGIEPYGYLREVLTRLPSMTNQQVASLTPRAWAEAAARGQRSAA